MTPASGRLSALIYALVLSIAAAATYAFWWQRGRSIYVPGSIPAGDKLQCVSYSPFGKDQSPLQPGFVIRPARMDADLALLSKYFSCVRTYSMTGLEQLPYYARKHGLKVMLGAWVSSDPVATQREIEQLIATANRYPDVVQSVVVGNEALLRKDISGARLARLIDEVKSRVKQPVTYADVWEFWRKYPQVARAVDFITIHLLPYWEDQPTGIDHALAHVAAVREEFGRLYAPKDVFIGETGWPSHGRQRETAVPSRINEAKFIRSFVAMAERKGWHYNLIEAFDQPWKRANEGAVGGYWGLFDADRHDKHILAGPVSNLPDWRHWLALSAAIGAAGLLLLGRPCTSVDAALAPALAAIAGTCAALWLYQAVMDNVDAGAWAWTWTLLAVNVLALLRGRIGLRGAGAAPPRWVLRCARDGLLAAGFVGAVLMAQLVFAARYREFPSCAVLLPALVYLRWPVVVPRRETLFLCAVIALGIPLQLGEEGLANTQALGWAAASALLAAALWRSSRTSRSPAISAANAAGVTV